jgi:predicted DNA binding CopG/RHH family protein
LAKLTRKLLLYGLLIEEMSSGYLVQHNGEKEGNYMNKNPKIIYKDIPEWEDGSELITVEDFLPKPEDLVRSQTVRKVTIELSDDSIEFFKKQAKKLNTSYQPMIRNLLDDYVRIMSK